MDKSKLKIKKDEWNDVKSGKKTYTSFIKDNKFDQEQLSILGELIVNEEDPEFEADDVQEAEVEQVQEEANPEPEQEAEVSAETDMEAEPDGEAKEEEVKPQAPLVKKNKLYWKDKFIKEAEVHNAASQRLEKLERLLAEKPKSTDALDLIEDTNKKTKELAEDLKGQLQREKFSLEAERRFLELEKLQQVVPKLKTSVPLGDLDKEWTYFLNEIGGQANANKWINDLAYRQEWEAKGVDGLSPDFMANMDKYRKIATLHANTAAVLKNPPKFRDYKAYYEDDTEDRSEIEKKAMQKGAAQVIQKLAKKPDPTSLSMSTKSRSQIVYSKAEFQKLLNIKNPTTEQLNLKHEMYKKLERNELV